MCCRSFTSNLILSNPCVHLVPPGIAEGHHDESQQQQQQQQQQKQQQAAVRVIDVKWRQADQRTVYTVTPAHAPRPSLAQQQLSTVKQPLYPLHNRTVALTWQQLTEHFVIPEHITSKRPLDLALPVPGYAAVSESPIAVLVLRTLNA